MDRLQGIVDQQSSARVKIALFRSLFRGRDDVYPRRFESRKTGKSGYAPACANEWVRGICEKPRIKCAECPHRRFLPVTDEVIRWHLSGQDDEVSRSSWASIRCCWTRPASSWPSISTRSTGARTRPRSWRPVACLGVPAALERSRSGHGGHVWLFFEEAVPAALARKLGAHVLTETMERRPDIGLDSYDRFFPNQDTLPQGGFGNLIALPLQKQPREHGNSVFLDDHFDPVSGSVGVSVHGAAESAALRLEDVVRDAERTRPRRRRAASGAGRRGRRAVGGSRRHVAAKEPPIVGRACRTRWNWCSGTRSTSPRTALRPGFATGCCAWRHFRTPSSTRRRRCACRPTTSRASSPAPRTIRNTSACRAVAWTTCGSC